MSELSAAQRGKIRRLAAAGGGATGGGGSSDEEGGGELNVVPFLDIITNVLMFVLATVTVAFTATADVKPPHPPTRSVAPTPAPLAVLVVDGGFAIKGPSGNVTANCSDIGAGLAVGKVDGSYDFVGLQRCAAKLKAASPDLATDDSVTISADPTIRYETLIATMDAVRRTDDGADLFPDVSFGVVR